MLPRSTDYGLWPEFIITNTSKLLYVQDSGVVTGGGGGTTITDLLVIDKIKKTIINKRQILGGHPLQKTTFVFNSGNNALYITQFSFKKWAHCAKT